MSVIEAVKPIEETDPEFARLVLKVVNGEIKAKVQDNKVYRRVGIKLEEVSGDIGRNDPCPCGSGKKYKKCCMKG
jgi:uncharacterized protein YecA (UPF0149 family)